IWSPMRNRTCDRPRAAGQGTAATTPAVRLTGARQPGLDRVRGTAILLVLTLHYGIHDAAALGDSPLWRHVASALSFSWSGVDLFFVLSGFLLGGTLMDRRGSQSYFKVFYVRRILRIVPLYALIVVIWLLVSGGSGFWMYATFTQNFVWGLTD